MLFQDLPDPMKISWTWLVPATILTTLFFIWIVTEGIRVKFASSKTGAESMIGKRVEVIERVNEHGGRVFVNGEYWNAVCDKVIEKGKIAEIVSVKGLTLTIKPHSSDTS
jgi:membrane-bound serine protease (ClpP class)